MGLTLIQARQIGRALSKGTHRLIETNPNHWVVVIPANQHDSALAGCMCIGDHSIVTIYGVEMEQYKPNMLYKNCSIEFIGYQDDPQEDEEFDG